MRPNNCSFPDELEKTSSERWSYYLYIYERQPLELNMELPDPPNVTIKIRTLMLATPLRRKWGEAKKELLKATCILCAYSCAN